MIINLWYIVYYIISNITTYFLFHGLINGILFVTRVYYTSQSNLVDIVMMQHMLALKVLTNILKNPNKKLERPLLNLMLET